MTNLRLPGQYDERLLGSLGLQGPYYNWNRWYLPGVGRYLEPDPIALAGGFNGEFGPDWYSYADCPKGYWCVRKDVGCSVAELDGLDPGPKWNVCISSNLPGIRKKDNNRVAPSNTAPR